MQPRVPAGTAAFPEIPAGMLDGDGMFQKRTKKEQKKKNKNKNKQELDNKKQKKYLFL